ncbi:MAG: hypothetical protein HY720_26380 [Planctomycetes bacterium]|nr:hypothetical protein [Planctomycetota bacterium]
MRDLGAICLSRATNDYEYDHDNDYGYECESEQAVFDGTLLNRAGAMTGPSI